MKGIILMSSSFNNNFDFGKIDLLYSGYTWKCACSIMDLNVSSGCSVYKTKNKRTILTLACFIVIRP